MSRTIPYLSDDCVTVFKSDSVEFTSGTVYVGYAGTVALVSANGSTGTFFAPAGSIIPVMTKKILSTGTTATGFVILY